MQEYLDTLRNVLENGNDRQTRNAKTRALFGPQMRFDMTEGFPMVTTKFIPFKSVASELLWFVEGSGDERRLAELLHGTRDSEKKTIWTGNRDADYWTERGHQKHPSDLGRIYGVQWRSWQSPDGSQTDQLAEVIERIKNDPTDRRLLVTAWNPGELDQMALPPCHYSFQFFVSDGSLSLLMNQRSCDMFLGVPFNIASYGLLLHMVCHLTDLKPKELILNLGDAHIYHDHFDQVREQLSRTPGPLPTLEITREVESIDDFTMDDFELIGYEHQGAIKAPMAV